MSRSFDKRRNTCARFVLTLFIVSCLNAVVPSSLIAGAPSECHVSDAQFSEAAVPQVDQSLPRTDCAHCPVSDKGAKSSDNLFLAACADVAACEGHYRLIATAGAELKIKFSGKYSLFHVLNSTPTDFAWHKNHSSLVGPPSSLNLRFCRFLI